MCPVCMQRYSRRHRIRRRLEPGKPALAHTALRSAKSLAAYTAAGRRCPGCSAGSPDCIHHRRCRCPGKRSRTAPAEPRRRRRRTRVGHPASSGRCWENIHRRRPLRHRRAHTVRAAPIAPQCCRCAAALPMCIQLSAARTRWRRTRRCSRSRTRRRLPRGLRARFGGARRLDSRSVSAGRLRKVAESAGRARRCLSTADPAH